MLHQSKRRNERNMLQCSPSTAVLTIICNAHRLEFYQLEGTELQWNGSRNVCRHKLILEKQYQPIVVRKNFSKHFESIRDTPFTMHPISTCDRTHLQPLLP